MSEADHVIALGWRLTAQDLAAIAAGAEVALAPEAIERMRENHAAYVEMGAPDVLAMKEAWLVGPRAASAAVDERIRGFVVSHCAGVGPHAPTAWVRALMATRAHQIALGFSGCRPALAALYCAMLNAGVHPLVPVQGSVGAAGDLAPLAHVARVAFRLGGRAERGGQELPAAQAMADLPAFSPSPKEALSAINGATLTAALAALACHRARRLLQTAEVALAMSMEVILANTDCLDPALLAARGHREAMVSAGQVWKLLAGSELAGPERRPDAFSIRCAPAVLGAAWAALEHVEGAVVSELNGACDNPLVIGGRLVEGGNFHGAPVALAMDYLKAALTQVGSVAERRTFRMTYGQLTGNLPSFLLESRGVSSGFMLAQYTAASLVSECKGLAHPASVDSIPTGQHHEDHVSMGPIAARGALSIIENLAEIVGIEIVVAGQGLEFRREGVTFSPDGERLQGEPTPLAPAVAGALATLREVVPRWHEDRVLHLDLAACAARVRAGAFVEPGPPW